MDRASNPGWQFVYSCVPLLLMAYKIIPFSTNRLFISIATSDTVGIILAGTCVPQKNHTAFQEVRGWILATPEVHVPKPLQHRDAKLCYAVKAKASKLSALSHAFGYVADLLKDKKTASKTPTDRELVWCLAVCRSTEVAPLGNKLSFGVNGRMQGCINHVGA